jgi:GrpB-like predicted nucleotidyltransferase (UPF0157 family)
MSPDRRRGSAAAIVTAVSYVDEAIAVVAYTSTWPTEFSHEAARLRSVIADEALAIEHIGSTAVAGLAAKPIIDVMIGVADLRVSDDLARALATAGYEDCGGAESRRYFRKRGGSQHFNVQLIEWPSSTWRDNIALRDYLRSDAQAAQHYSEAKRAAAKQAPTLLAYSRLKAPVLQDLIEIARASQG